MSKKNIKIILLIILALPLISFAQVGGTGYTLSNELGVELIPNYPRPNALVSIILTLYTDDLTSADIAWYKDGKVVLEGKGETKYSFRMGKVGEETKIEIRIRLLSGSTFSKSFTLNPTGLDLIWEANSYTPPFYKGKALHPRQGNLRVVAMPEFIKNGRRIPAENLVYEWGNGVEMYQNQSGYGKQSIVISGSILGRGERVEVLVTDPVNNLVAEGFLNINPIDPEIVFYENHPYYGPIFDSIVNNNFDLEGEEVQILAAPFYFSKGNSNSMVYEWRLNGQALPNLSGSRTAIFRKPEESGVSLLSLNIENTNRLLQQANTALRINFEE